MVEITRRERKKEATKANIMQTAISLFEKQGFAATTMNQIAEEADVALGTLYNYFASKEAFVGEYMQVTVEGKLNELGDILGGMLNTYEKLKYVCDVSAQWMEKNRTLTEIFSLDPWNYCFGPTEKEIPRSGLDEVIAGIMTDGQEKGELRREFTAELLTRQFMGMYYFAILTWLANPAAKPLAELFGEGLELLCKGMITTGTDTASVIWGFFC